MDDQDKRLREASEAFTAACSKLTLLHAEVTSALDNMGKLNQSVLPVDVRERREEALTLFAGQQLAAEATAAIDTFLFLAERARTAQVPK